MPCVLFHHVYKVNFYCICIVFFLSFPFASLAEEPDWSDYLLVLNTHLKTGIKNGTTLTLVDYSALRKTGEINKVAMQIERFNINQLSNRAERLAFYINAYNVFTMKMVLDNMPLESIKDAGGIFTSVWKMTAGQLGGGKVSLDDIEHNILRPMGEPRIHFAIVCASVSCPDLRMEPYTSAQLEQQLADQAKRFLSNNVKGLRQEKNIILVSKIFDWFEEDFQRVNGISAFIQRYNDTLPLSIEVDADLSYDWSLNGS